jgi:hypothetical protein
VLPDSANDPADELQIRNLLAHVARAADTATDAELDSQYLDCFTQDAVWESRLATLPDGVSSATRRGRAELRTAALERRRSGLQGPGTHSMHLVMTSVVRIDGSSATAQSSFVLLGDLHEKAGIVAAGIYDDQLRRDEGRWRLAHRVLRQP